MPLARIALFTLVFLIGLLSRAQVSIAVTSNTDSACAGTEIRIYSGLSGVLDSFFWELNPSIEGMISSSDKDSLVYQLNSNFSSDTVELKVLFRGYASGVIHKDSIAVILANKPEITLMPDFALCCNSGPLSLDSVALTSSDPPGGKWSVPTFPALLSGDSIYPDQACLQGLSNSKYAHYTYTSSISGCSNSDSIRITINPLPLIRLNSPTFCEDLGSFSIEDEIVAIPGNTNNGTQSWRCIQCNGNEIDSFIAVTEPVQGITTHRFYTDAKHYIYKNDSKDTVILEYTFTNAFGCSNTDTVSIYLIKVPIIVFDGPRELCWDEGEFDLNQLANVQPLGGYWEVISQSGYRDPAELGGIQNGSIINTLNSTEQVSGSGSTEFLIRYTYNLSGCPIYRDTVLIINPRPSISLIGIDGETFCEKDDPINLQATPIGGTWTASDAGVLTGTNPVYFDPSRAIPGQPITLTYYFKNPITQCDNADSLVIQTQVSPKIELPEDLELCNVTGQKINVDITALVAENLPNGIIWQQVATPGATITRTAINGDTASFELIAPNDTIYTFLILASSGFVPGACGAVQDRIRIKIYPIPDAEIISDETSGCSPLEYNLHYELLNNNGEVASAWTINGSGSLEDSITGIITDAGTHAAILLLTSENGCDTTLSLDLHVFPNPVAHFTPNPNNQAFIVDPEFQFINGSSVGDILDSRIVSHMWDFGVPDTSYDTSNQVNPFFSYPDTGTYLVKLYVETNYGCSDSFVSSVIVKDVVNSTEMDLLIFPNPATDEIAIYAEPDQISNQVVQLYDELGRLVKEIPWSENGVVMDISELAPAVYFVRLGDSKKYVARIIKKY